MVNVKNAILDYFQLKLFLLSFLQVCDPHRIKKLAEARKLNDPNHPGCVIYSIGSNGDFSFEQGLQNEVGENVCEFHIIDPGDFAGMKPSGLKRASFITGGGLKSSDQMRLIHHRLARSFTVYMTLSSYLATNSWMSLISL